MDLQTYWLIVAPGLLFGLSLIGWVALWVTAPGGGAQRQLEEANYFSRWWSSHSGGWRLAVVAVPAAIMVLILAWVLIPGLHGPGIPEVANGGVRM
jgi:hypothetical protein